MTPLSADKTRLSFLRAPLRASIKPELTKGYILRVHDPCDSTPAHFLFPLTFPVSFPPRPLPRPPPTRLYGVRLLCTRPFVSNREAGTFPPTGSSNRSFRILLQSHARPSATLPPTFYAFSRDISRPLGRGKGEGGDSISSARISYESFGFNHGSGGLGWDGRCSDIDVSFRSLARKGWCTCGEIYFIGRFVTFVGLFGR